MKPNVKRMSLAWLWIVVGGCFAENASAVAQFGPGGPGGPGGVNIPVQLPTVTSFGLSTAVMVPDGGTLRLGGVTRGASGHQSSGIPMLSQLPGTGPLFRSQAWGSSYSSAQSSVRVHLIISQEIEEDVLAEAERRIAARRELDPNGTPEVQRRAQFMSRNIGRR